MPGSDRSLFLEHGQVDLDALDLQGRQACLRVVAPFCVVQAATPILLGHGLMDEFRIHNPLAVWMPPIRLDAFKDVVRNPHPDVAVQARTIVNQHVSRLLTVFQEVAQAMDDPSELVPMLPIGTYVHVRYRCGIDELARAVEKLDEVRVAGVPEARFALAEVLAFILSGPDRQAPALAAG